MAGDNSSQLHGMCGAKLTLVSVVKTRCNLPCNSCLLVLSKVVYSYLSCFFKKFLKKRFAAVLSFCDGCQRSFMQ